MFFRTPSKKDHHGWHGPAELISLKRRAGSAICDVQGMPLVVPLRNIRRHVLESLWVHFAGQDSSFISEHFHVNPELGSASAEVYLNEDFC